MPPPPTEDEVNKGGDHADEQTSPVEETAASEVAAAVITTTVPHPPPSAEAVARAAAALQAAFSQPLQPPPPPKGKRKSRDILDVPSRDPTCHECGKKFGNWKAVFGHLRVHAGRPFRGAFPPPVGPDWTASSSSVPDNSQRWPQQEPRLGLGIDLNVPYMPMINDDDDGDEVDVTDPKRVRILEMNRRALEEATAKKDGGGGGNRETDEEEEEEERDGDKGAEQRE
ncbi:unnamed protein product [Linum trigynum]|uniref:C2H2-type domain-containing protein n=1 Tax=Linum trigynum TaxID=586398 RepID=A0AAV2F5E8_9ROSI